MVEFWIPGIQGLISKHQKWIFYFVESQIGIRWECRCTLRPIQWRKSLHYRRVRDHNTFMLHGAISTYISLTMGTVLTRSLLLFIFKLNSCFHLIKITYILFFSRQCFNLFFNISTLQIMTNRLYVSVYANACSAITTGLSLKVWYFGLHTKKWAGPLLPRKFYVSFVFFCCKRAAGKMLSAPAGPLSNTSIDKQRYPAATRSYYGLLPSSRSMFAFRYVLTAGMRVFPSLSVALRTLF